MNEVHVPEIRKGVYRHYKKGDLVEVIGIAIHSETLEPFVSYRHLTGEHAHETNYWVRPYEMFIGEVDQKGVRQPRFVYQHPTP
jgi:hypothetical protein